MDDMRVHTDLHQELAVHRLENKDVPICLSPGFAGGDADVVVGERRGGW